MRKREDFIRLTSQNSIFWLIGGVGFSCSATSFRSKKQAKKDALSLITSQNDLRDLMRGFEQSVNYTFPKTLTDTDAGSTRLGGNYYVFKSG